VLTEINYKMHGATIKIIRQGSWCTDWGSKPARQEQLTTAGGN